MAVAQGAAAMPMVQVNSVWAVIATSLGPVIVNEYQSESRCVLFNQDVPQIFSPQLMAPVAGGIISHPLLVVLPQLSGSAIDPAGQLK